MDRLEETLKTDFNKWFSDFVSKRPELHTLTFTELQVVRLDLWTAVKKFTSQVVEAETAGHHEGPESPCGILSCDKPWPPKLETR